MPLALLDGGPDRVTLVGNRLKLQRGGSVTNTEVVTEDWSETLSEWFGIEYRLDGPPRRSEDAS